MLFGLSRNREIINWTFGIEINNDRITIVNEAKSLVVIIDSKSRFEKHITKLI